MKSSEFPPETVFVRIERLCDQWGRNAPPLPADARHLLRKLAKEIVLEAAGLCDLRAQPEDKSMSVRNEARKCGDAIRFFLLCAEDETICLHCDGAGCPRCNHEGIRKQGGKR
jgi:hypothetical protein